MGVTFTIANSKEIIITFAKGTESKLYLNLKLALRDEEIPQRSVKRQGRRLTTTDARPLEDKHFLYSDSTKMQLKAAVNK